MQLGDYRLVRPLPSTTPGVDDYVALHAVLPREARVRVGSTSRAQTLLREACVLEAARGPGVPRIYECGLLDDGGAWLAIELIDAPALTDALPLDVIEALAIARDTAEILERVHERGIAHLGLRPEIVVRTVGGVQIIAWDTAQRHDAPAFDVAADVRALGTLVQTAIGTAPIPRGVAALLERVATRPPTPADLRAQLARCIDDVEVLVEDIELPPPQRRLA